MFDVNNKHDFFTIKKTNIIFQKLPAKSRKRKQQQAESFQQQVGAGSPFGRWVFSSFKAARRGIFLGETGHEKGGSSLQGKGEEKYRTDLRGFICGRNSLEDSNST